MRAPRFQSRLINRLSWFNVLPLLGCDITTTSLPAAVKCPVCQELGCKVLTIAPGKGEWVCCPSCHTLIKEQEYVGAEPLRVVLGRAVGVEEFLAVRGRQLNVEGHCHGSIGLLASTSSSSFGGIVGR
jgi:hypothetical protein